jgi:hypothetical protein
LGQLTYLALKEADNPEKVRQYMLLAEEQMATASRIAKQTLGFAQHSEKPKKVDLVASLQYSGGRVLNLLVIGI